LALLLTSSGVGHAAAPVNPPKVSLAVPFTASDQSFSFELPQGWKGTEKGHPYGDLTPIFGVRLSGPIGPDGVAATISVLHYSGEDRFTTPEEFIRNKLNSMVRIDDTWAVPITDTKVAGRPAKAFQIRSFKLVYLPQAAVQALPEGVVAEMNPPHKQIDMVAQYLVVPASKGYFVLGLCAPEKSVEEHRRTFDRVVGSFHPDIP